MARINVLDAQTANLIAAGEVVERPANVIKELLENAIDAKSTRIVSEIAGGGIEMIRVTDDGCGMEKEDLPLSIRRHATSKIENARDLAGISTLGFCGEALAAISSTSRFTLMSKRREDEIGCQMITEGEKILSLDECGCADGTTVIVQDLFFNQPARKKFLKRPQTESGAILQYLQRIAVSHPEISFQFICDGVVKLQTMGNGRLSDCIYSVYGKEFSSSLTEVDLKEGPFHVYGFITRPEYARNNHSWQTFYINSRFVKSRTMQFALEDAYKSFVKSEKFPGCVLFLDLDPEKVDVNVHPAKLEVRFEDERSVYQAVYRAVRGTLSNLSNRMAQDEFQRAAAAAKTDGEVLKIHEIRQTTPPSREAKSGLWREQQKELSLFSSAHSRGRSPLVPKEDEAKEKEVIVESVSVSDLFRDREKRATEPEKAGENTQDAGEQLGMDAVLPREKKDNPLTLLGVIRGTLFHAYILYETGDTVYLVDKHAAHERILYESLKKSHREDSVQLFLEPLVVTLTATEATALAEHLDELEEAGFPLEEFGESSFLLRGIPLEFTSLSGEDVRGLLEEAAKELALGGKAGGAGEKRFDRTLYSIACKGAVKAGIPSTESDHQWIVEKLREIDNITVCPHGRPVLVPFSKKQIENLFLRT